MDACLASPASTRKRAAANISRARIGRAWPISAIPSSSCMVPELRRQLHGVREIPIEFPRPRIERPRLKLAVVDPDDGCDLGEIAARGDLVGGLERLIEQGRLEH